MTTNTITRRPTTHDAIVVGGRVAGAATAMLLARRGARVLVLERGSRGADTLSTHALMRAGVLQLARWGVLERVAAAGTPAIREVRFHHPGETITVPVKPGPGYEGLCAPRRTVLDPILLDAAEEAGAEVRFGATVRTVERDAAGRVTGVSGRLRDGRTFSATAPVVIGADGTRSLVARAVDAPVLARGVATTAVVYGYFTGVEARGYEWCFAPGAAGGLVPTNDGETLVFAGVPGPAFRDRMAGDVEAGFWSVLEEVTPAVAERVRDGRLRGRFRSFPGMPGYLRRSHGPGWALVGDAGYFKDPITAHGMTDALRDAELAADAVTAFLGGAGEHGALAAYQARRDGLSADLFRVTEAIAAHASDPVRLKELLIELSVSMSAEVEELSSRPPMAPTLAA
ncbi:MAG: NAD(P)/FAD-dependent oxidoreductase [Acidimicrobiia bacterium]|nr:NAD(P)/FAD-dependent oxidoreductase [Acidimicrobiia bacterium]